MDCIAWRCGRIGIMPKKYTDEFKGDVVAMVHQGGVTQRQIAKDFGISKSALASGCRKLSVTSCWLLGHRLEGRPMMRRCCGRR